MPRMTHKVRQMYMAVRIQQHIIWLDIPVHYPLLVYVPERAAQLGDPEPYSLLGKRLSGDMESKISAIH